MAKNRKSQSASIHFGPVLKVVLMCFIFCGSAVGYVWEKSKIADLGRQKATLEKSIFQLKQDNKSFADQISMLHSPVMIDQRVRALNLGLAPAQPGQVVRLMEEKGTQQLAGRPLAQLTQ